MSVSPYFKNFSYQPTQNLIENLVIEAIKHRGYDIFYLPRHVENMDDLLNESPSSTFKDAIRLEVYIKNISQFDGMGDMITRIGGYTIDDSITFTVAKKRFLQSLSSKIMDERGYNLIPEDANPKLYNNITGFALEQDGYDYTQEIIRPQEGDLIYFPLANKIFEIKFVEHESVFYQFGKNYVFDMECGLLDYSNEVFETGDMSIDRIYKKFDTNPTHEKDSLLIEDENEIFVQNEDNSFVEIESGSDEEDTQEKIEEIDKVADNNEIQKESDRITDREKWLYGGGF